MQTNSFAALASRSRHLQGQPRQPGDSRAYEQAHIDKDRSQLRKCSRGLYRIVTRPQCQRCDPSRVPDRSPQGWDRAWEYQHLGSGCEVMGEGARQRRRDGGQAHARL